MSTTKILSNKINQYVIDIKSDKVTTRQSALDGISTLFDNQPDDVTAVLECGDEDCMSWKNLFIELNYAVQEQCNRLDSARSATNSNTIKNKNDAFKGALIKCINLANQHKLNVPLRNICEVAFECFGNATMRKYFDGCYLKIINTHILNTKFSLDNLELTHWSQLLSAIFELYGDQDTAISKLELLQCIPALLKHASRYTYLIGDLAKYLPTLVIMIKDESHQYRAQKQILLTIYEVIRCMASSQRKVMVEFTEKVLDRIYKMYQFSLDDDVKEVMFKIFHVSIVIHSPQNDQATVNYRGSKDLFADNVAHDINQWHKLLQNMFGVVEREIIGARKLSKRQSPKSTICNELVQMAAKLCSVIYWNESVWASVTATTTTATGNDEQAAKRRRHTMKLERIMELAEYELDKFCWRWFAILSELLVSFPHLLGADDYQPLLKLLTNYQSTIVDASDMKSFNKIVKTMLDAQMELIAAPLSPIRSSFCTENWHKIMEFAFKQAATDKIQIENLKLIGILVKQGIIVSYDFIKTIITDILKTTNIRKSNVSIELLINIFRSINVDLINGIHDIKMSVIKWLSTRIAATELKRVIASVNDLDEKLIAELYVLCILSRQGQSNTFVKKFENKKNNATTIREIEKNLQYRVLNKLIVCDLKKCSNQNKPKHSTNLPDRSEVKAIINETFNARMEESLYSDDSAGQPGTSNNNNQMENFMFVCKSLQTYVNVLNCLIDYEAIDAEALNTSNLKKRILIRIGQLNDIVEKFDSRVNVRQNPEDVMEIVSRLLKVWNDDNHLAVANILYTHKNDSIISWFLKQLTPSQRPASRVIDVLKHENLMEFRYRVQLRVLTLVAHFSVWQNIDSDNQVFEGIQEYDFELARNEDMFMVFELVKAIFNQRLITEAGVEWAFERLKEICSEFSKNQHLIEMVMEILPATIRCVKHYEILHDDLFQLLSVVLTQSRKRKYGQSITVKVIKCLQYFAREFFLHEDCSNTLNVLKKFLVSEYLPIQLATVECLTNIFNKHWLCPDVDSDLDCLKVQNFQMEVFERLNLNEMPRFDGDDAVTITMDRKANLQSIYLQLFSSIIGTCFVLRRQMWFQLIDFCCNQIQLKNEKIEKLTTKLCTDMFNADPSILLKQDIDYLLGRWITIGYNIAVFPWKQLTSSPSKNDFILEHIECITLNIVIHQPHLLQEWVQTAAKPLSQLLTKSVLIKCLAFSINANHSALRERKDHGRKVIETLPAAVRDLEQYLRTDSLQIMQEMLNEMCDRVKFVELFNMNVEYTIEKNAMDYGCFIKCMDYIQKKCDRQQSSLLTYFCQHDVVAVINVLYSLKLSIQQSPCEELKLYQLFRLCVLIDIITTEFLVKHAQNAAYQNVIEFFVKDFIYLFGNMIIGSASMKIKLAACNNMYRFSKSILPKCTEQFEPHLNYVVSVLMPITKIKPTKIVVNKAMDLLNFLINEQQNALHMYIGLLDTFPSSPEFDKLRQIQNDSKYDGKPFTLLDEIECFLAIDKRKTEGLLSLKEHLSSKKSELKKMYEHIYDSRGFSEDCDKSVIHRLIFTLLQTVQSNDKEKSILAVKCLGELGPSDLGTMCLRFDSQPQNYKDCPRFADAVEHLCGFMLDKLNGLFAHSDANVLKATLTACQRLLRSRKVTEFLNKYPSLSIFKTTSTMELPFKQPKGQLDLLKWFDETALMNGHSVWIKNIAIELFTFFECEYLAELAAMRAQFSAAMVPLLVKVILTTGVRSYLDDISKSINIFFANHATKEDSHQSGLVNTNVADPPVYKNKISIKLMLNVAECVRIHNQFLETRTDVTMNYLHIAKAASFCDAHFTAILYGELLALDEATQTDVTVINSIMMNAYKAIGESDAVSAFINPITDPIQYLISKKDWGRTLNILDVSPMSTMNQYLGQAGLYGLSNKLSKATDSTNFDAAWRLGDWTVLNDNATTQEINDFEKYHYYALKSLQQKDEIAVRFNIENGINEVIKGLKSSSYECTKNIYKDLMKLRMLQQIEEFCDVQFPRPDNVKQNSPEFIIQKWKHQDAVPSNEFICREPILAQRIILFQSAGIRAQRKIENVCNLATNSIQEMILKLAFECREEGYLTQSQRYLASLREMNPTGDIKIKMLFENAKLAWDIGDHVLTKHLLDAVRNSRIISHVPIAAVGMYGEYLAETRAENTKTIIEEYFKESNKMSKALKIKLESDAQINQTNQRNSRLSIEVVQKFYADNKIRNLCAMAKYADREYQQIAAYKRSSDFEKKQQNVEKNSKIIADLDSASSSLTSNERKSHALMKRSVQIDEADIKSTNDEYNWYLEMTVHTYLNCLVLEQGDETDCFIMFRVFALLLANPTNAKILELIKIASVSIPTFKFIEVIPQITAHLNANNDAFGNLIHEIVLKCAKEHPHHVIVKLFALANAHIDGNHSGDTPSPARTDASRTILCKLRSDESTRSIVEQMEQMCTTLIKLANKKIEGRNTLSSQEPLLAVRNLNKIHCPTVKLNVSPSANYSGNIVGISKYSNELMRPGGINAPKRIACIGTDGKKYLQLLKGEDDPRQDAVMQQVFCIVNNMLNQSKVTKKDRLIIRTYAVIPLSQRSGILEWCTNTTTMAEYLIGSNSKSGAHQRYRPQDLSPSDCRNLYSQVDRTYPLTQRHLNFLNICKQIQPVFHHFFFEYFYNPGVWYERRLAYAHSLATTSMMCYILGIGDRHVNNILIDKTTAELIHIDFGIAFEQAKCLPTPELIPFRLTRDLISALGPSKVEGVFKKTCEKTMQVLRQHKSTILTIVEVLMHDPLNAWTLTSSEAAKRQQTDIHLDEQDVNAMAERALLRLEEKLDGKHVSRSDSLSVERHVELLIQEATDDTRLCRLYVGWQPYL